MTDVIPYQKLKTKALKALARREHSRLELKQKLSQVSNDHTLIEKVLTECEEHDWLNEVRFVNAYLNYRAQRCYGPRKIRFELTQRGIDPQLIEQAFHASTIDWEELAQQTRQRKFGGYETSSWEERAKQSQYLYQRGF